MVSLTQGTWVWASSRRWWMTGKSAVLPFMVLSRVRHDSVTGQQQQISIWSKLKKKCNLHLYLRLYNFFIITETSTSMFSQLVSSVTQSCLTLCNPIDFSRPGFPVHHQLPGLAQTHVHWVDHVIQPCHPLSSSSSPAFYLSQHQGLCQWVS